jgi:hypothetical protein
MRDITLSELQRLEPAITEADDALQMDQDSFASFDRLPASLGVPHRRTNDAQLADDLQETYYRFLELQAVYESESHRKNYLFRIASNRQRAIASTTSLSNSRMITRPLWRFRCGRPNRRRTDLNRALARLKPRRETRCGSRTETLRTGRSARILGVRSRASS